MKSEKLRVYGQLRRRYLASALAAGLTIVAGALTALHNQWTLTQLLGTQRSSLS
jgi:hypothetical protein